MAIIKSATDPKAWRKKKKKKDVTPPAGTAGRGGAAIYKPKPAKPKNEFDAPQPMERNIANLSRAWEHKYGGAPTAQQAYSMLNSTQQTLSMKEWTGFLAPGIAENPFTARMMKITSAYLSTHGVVPSAAKLRALLLADDATGGTGDVVSVMPISVPGIQDSRDKSIFDMVAGDSQDKNNARLSRPLARWTRTDLKKMPTDPKTKQEADRLRELANRPMHSLDKTWDRDSEDRITNADIDRINAARDWYNDTSGKKKLNLLQHRKYNKETHELSPNMVPSLVKEDGTDDVEAVRFLAEISGQNNGSMKDPHTFVAIRRKTEHGGKLSKGVQADLNIFGSKLSSLYPEVKPDKDGNYKWNPVFDRAASTFLFYANLEEATALNDNQKDTPEWDAKEKKRKIAQANISIATHGGIKTDDNMRDWMKSMGFLGKKGETSTFSEQFTTFLFEECYLKVIAPDNEPITVSLFQFASQRGGKEALPQKYQKYYDDVQAEWATSVAALAFDRDNPVSNPVGALFEVQMQAVQDAYKNQIPEIGKMPDTKTGFEKPKESMRRGGIPGAELGYDPEHIKVGERVVGLGGKGGSSMQVTEIDKDDPVGMFLNFEVFPRVSQAVGVVGDVFNKIEQTKNRLWLTLALMAEYGGGRHISGGMLNPMTQATTLTNEYLGRRSNKIAAATDPRNFTVPLSAKAYDWDTVTRAWNDACKAAGENGNAAYINHEYRALGLDPEKDNTLFFVGDLAWSIMIDVGTDAMLGGLAKGGARLAAKNMRNLTAPGLVKKIDAAEKGIKDAGLADLDKQFTDMNDEVELLAKRENDARKWGDMTLADSFKARSEDVKAARTTLADSGGASILFNNDDYIARELLRRPMWYDTFATGLARNKMTGVQVKNLLGTRLGHVAPSMQEEFKIVLQKIGDSSDADEIVELMNRARVKFQVTLDPGRLFLGKMRFYNISMGNDAYGNMSRILPVGERLSDEAENVSEHVLALGTATRCGMDKSQDVASKRLIWDTLEKLHNLDHSLPIVQLNFKRQIIWGEFADAIKANMVKREVDADTLKKLQFWAKTNKIDWDGELSEFIKNQWDAYQAMRNIKGAKRTKLDFGTERKAWYDVVQPEQPFLLAGKKSTGQQSKDLVTPFNMQDISAFQRGHMSQQMAVNTQVVGWLPSWMGVVNAGRTLAVASMSFPFSALFIDEFWRVIPELLEGNLDFTTLRKSIGRTKKQGLRLAASDAAGDLMQMRDKIVQISPGDSHYNKFFNRYVAGYTENDFYDIYKNLRDEIGIEGMDQMEPAQLRAVFRAKLVDTILDPANAELRKNMFDTGRGFKHLYDTPEHIARQQEEWQKAGDALEKEYGEAWVARRKALQERAEFLTRSVEISGPRPSTMDTPLTSAQLGQLTKLENRKAAILEAQAAKPAPTPPKPQKAPKPAPKAAEPGMDTTHIDRVIQGVENDIKSNTKLGLDTRKLEDKLVRLKNAREGFAGDGRVKVVWERPDSGAPVKLFELPDGRLIVAEGFPAKKATKTKKAQKAYVEVTVYKGVNDQKVLEKHGPFFNAGEAEKVADDIANPPAVKWDGRFAAQDRIRADYERLVADGMDPDKAAKKATANENKRNYDPQDEVDFGELDEAVPDVVEPEKAELAWNAKPNKGTSVADYTSADGRFGIVKGDGGWWHIFRMDGPDLGDAISHGNSERSLKDAKTFIATHEDEIDALLPVKAADTSVQDEAIAAELKRIDDKVAEIKGSRTTSEAENLAGNIVGVKKALLVNPPNTKSWVDDWLIARGLPPLPALGDANTKVFNPPYDYFKIKRFFMQAVNDEDLYKQMVLDHRAEILAQRGVTDLAEEAYAFDDAVKAARARLNDAKKQRKTHQSTPYPFENELDDAGKEWLEASMDKLELFGRSPLLWEKANAGKKLTRADIRAIREDMATRGEDLPPVAGVKMGEAGWLRGHGSPGNVPILSKYAELMPYKVLNFMGNKSRQIMFLGNFQVEYKRLGRLGLSEDERITTATKRALTYVDKVMYSPGMTPLESDLGAAFYFLPAFRQATLYWGKQFVKHPMVYQDIREAIAEDMPMVYGPRDTWLGGYGAFMPMPFWATGGIAESAIPGLVAPALYPLRFLNTLSGWDEVPDPDGKPGATKMAYTGTTEFDWLAENAWLNPVTGFASKNISPLSVIDDLWWGVRGEKSYNLEADDDVSKVWATFMLALRKDPILRTKTANDIMMIQMSNGGRPDTDAYVQQFKGSPQWYSFFKETCGFAQPEAILGAITRQFTPRKVTYSPSDIGTVTTPTGNANDKTLWDQFNLFGDGDARTLNQAQFEMYEADGNKEKQQAILAKYPKLKKKYDFYKLDAYDREQFLLQKENQWLIPYVSGRTFYDENGAPLTNQEYHALMTTGALRKKANTEYMKGVDKLYTNLQWTEKLHAYEAKRDADLKAVHKWAVQQINKYAVSKLDREAKLKSLWYYERFPQETAPSEYANGINSADYFIKVYARREFGAGYKNHQNKWDAQAVVKNFEDATALESDGGNRPEGAYSDGLEDFYSNDVVKRFKTEEGAGEMAEIYKSVYEVLRPRDRKTFDKKQSISYHAFVEKRKKDAAYRKYAMDKIAGSEYYTIRSAAHLESAMPGIFDPVTGIGTEEQMDEWLYDASEAYQIKKAAAGDPLKPDYYSDKYEAALKTYDKTMARLLKKPIAAPFQDGLAGRLLMTYMVDPGEGKTYDKLYVTRVLRELAKDQPDYESLVDGYSAAKMKRPEKAEAANAWASTLRAALMLREKIAHERAEHPNDGNIGKVSGNAAVKLDKYVNFWKKRSDRFRREWDKQGGSDMISNFFSEGKY